MDNKEKRLSNLLKQDEFYLADLFKIAFDAVRKSKKIVIGLLICIILLFTLDYIISPFEFESKATVMVEQQSSTNSNSLSSLLGLSNNMSSSSGNGDLGPGMYSELFKSQVFLNEIIQTKFLISEDSKDSITLEQYFSNGENLSFYQKIKNPSSFFSQSETKKESKKINKDQRQSIITNLDSALIIKKNISPELIFSNQIPPIV